MRTEKVTKTVILPLETSGRKNARIRQAIEEWQTMAKTVADHHPSFEPSEWGKTKQNPSFYRIIRREYSDRSIHSSGALAAVHKVGSAFQSWRGNGMNGRQPQFGDRDYCAFTDAGVDIRPNGRGYGLKVSVEPWRPEWFHINDGDYQREYLDRIEAGELSVGSAELHLSDGRLTCYLAVSEPVEVLEWGEVVTDIGVDLGRQTLYAAAAVNGDVTGVTIESGTDYQQRRYRVERKKDGLQQAGDLRQTQQNQYRNYTDHVMHVVAREIVDFAEQYERPGIALEDLTHHAERSRGTVVGWPYAELQSKILYKATESGIPVRKVNPDKTSITCRKCGVTDPRSRDEDDFKCVRCGYEVHADVNAAINIANGGA